MFLIKKLIFLTDPLTPNLEQHSIHQEGKERDNNDLLTSLCWERGKEKSCIPQGFGEAIPSPNVCNVPALYNTSQMGQS